MAKKKAEAQQTTKSVRTAGIRARASSLPRLLSCSKMWTESSKQPADSLGGEAAQTGNLVHVAMNIFHSSKKRDYEGRVADAKEAMKQAKENHYTGGDLATAETLFRSWFSQEIKASKGKVIGTEIELSVKLPVFYSAAALATHRQAKVKPIPEEEWTLTGHIDEARDVEGQLWICDEKTGWTAADKMTGHYAAQIAGYVVGAALTGLFPGYTKYRGYVKRTRDLMAGSDPYFYKVISNYDQAMNIMEIVGLRLGEIAQGVVNHVPGEHCRFCPMMSYPDCLDGKVRDINIEVVTYESKPKARGKNLPLAPLTSSASGTFKQSPFSKPTTVK